MGSTTDRVDDWRLALLNDWQQRFPLDREPFAVIARQLDVPTATVLTGYRGLLRDGTLSRIGGVFGAGAGGAALLAAMAVPAARLEAVAAIVSAHPGVNHNYERENELNLWFVMTGRDATRVELAMQALEQATAVPALRLRMQRAYRIDLGFDLRGRVAPGPAPVRSAQAARPGPVSDEDWPLAALVEDGLPLVEHPFDAWAEALGCSVESVRSRLVRWLDQGTLKRFGAVVRHHELGYTSNAMTVFDVPDAEVDARGAALAGQRGVTLCYRRERAPRWPYNLYCMVHGRDRASVHAVLEAAIADSGLQHARREVLFSQRRFKQVGARRFRDAWLSSAEVAHAA
ncbi:MAG: Lrp/AsnC family transcriptional regulator [Aquabacterium sp.]|jgi:DNA-binding Lrp family transcriptional regulator|nr:Lrp/AsnC family transcriptional regulator [Aquabacterium sp.]